MDAKCWLVDFHFRPAARAPRRACSQANVQSRKQANRHRYSDIRCLLVAITTPKGGSWGSPYIQFSPYRYPTQPRKAWPHQWGLRPLLFLISGVGSYTSNKNEISESAVRLEFSSLSEKTRESNRFQMLLQRQHFLLSCLKTLSVGPAGVWTCDLLLSRPALSQLS